MNDNGDADRLAQLASALADGTRVRLLHGLREAGSPGMTVNDLADHLELPQPRISTHLSVLKDSGLVSRRALGRARIYQIAPVGRTLLGALEDVDGQVSPARGSSSTSGRVVNRNLPLRQARSCYDHVAGLAGVDVLDHLIFNRWLSRAGGEDARPAYAITESGERALTALGVDLGAARASRRMLAGGCLDWTERRFHLAGSLGAAILVALQQDGVVAREGDGRQLTLIGDLDAWLNRV